MYNFIASSDSLCAVSPDLLIFINNRFTREEDESALTGGGEGKTERENVCVRVCACVFRAEYNNAVRLQSP